MNAQKSLPTDLIDSLLANCKKPEDLVGENGLLEKISKTLVERDVHAERGHGAIFQVREIDRG